MIKTSDDLKNTLCSINNKSYSAYKNIFGQYRFKNYILSVDHVQGDPFASPSNLRIIVNQKEAGFSEGLFDKKYKKTALCDYLTRLFYKNINKFSSFIKGSGKSGLISISKCGQEILERTAVIIDKEKIEARILVGFPARGRTVLAKELEKILFVFLPEIVSNTLIYKNLNHNEIKEVLELSTDQNYIRKFLKENNLAAFIADGSVIPRESGVSDKPLKNAVKFKTPLSLQTEITLPFKGKITGMGIKNGITLLVGGGFHGKSTLLRALELGVYNHIKGDGREYVITDESAVKVRAEDGRFIKDTDISLFISNLPSKKDTRKFSTDNASGSTSQAAGIIDGIESGTKLFLIDEDTSATNFMVRDDLMQQLISTDKEPITPFIDTAGALYKQKGISTILVAGSSGAYFDIADTVIQMDCYVPKDVTAKAKKLASENSRNFIKNNSDININFSRKLKKGMNEEGPKGIKIKSDGKDALIINKELINLRALEQITDTEQVNALGFIMRYIEKFISDDNKTVQEAIDEVLNKIEKDGLLSVSSVKYGSGNLALPRKHEITACINRFRNLKL